MKNKNLPRLIQQFLKKSPRSSASRRNIILPPQYRNNLSRLPTDQQYIKNFIVHIDCSYMYNYYGAPTTNEHKMYLHKKSFVNPTSAGLVRRKIIEINDKTMDKKQMLFQLIKGLNKDKQTILRYTEIQEFLMKLSLEQTRTYKKIIVYLYKWLLNEKHNFPSQSIQQQLCQQLSELVIKKIYDAHQKGDYELLKNTEEELFLIENLQKAREHKKAGKMEQAKDTYQLVYFGRVTDEADRMEALQFICDRSKEEKDFVMLENMVTRIKEGEGIRVHQKTLTRAINQIQQMIKTQSTQDQIVLNPLMTSQQPSKMSENKPIVGKKIKELFMDEKDSLRKRGSRKVKVFGGTLIDEDEFM